MAISTRTTDSYDDDTVVANGSSSAHDSGTNWWPLLLIPLFLLVALAGVSAYQNGYGMGNTGSVPSPNNQYNSSNTMPPSGAEMGIGGAGVVDISPTPTMTITPLPTESNIPPVSIQPVGGNL